MDNLVRSGFAFMRELDGGWILMENKFTGLRIEYNELTGSRRVVS